MRCISGPCAGFAPCRSAHSRCAARHRVLLWCYGLSFLISISSHNHRTTESCDHKGWKSPLGSPTQPTPPCPLPTSLSATSPWFWNTSRDGDPTTPRAAVPVPDCSFREEIVPNIQPEASLKIGTVKDKWRPTRGRAWRAKGYFNQSQHASCLQ